MTVDRERDRQSVRRRRHRRRRQRPDLRRLSREGGTEAARARTARRDRRRRAHRGDRAGLSRADPRARRGPAAARRDRRPPAQRARPGVRRERRSSVTALGADGRALLLCDDPARTARRLARAARRATPTRGRRSCSRAPRSAASSPRSSPRRRRSVDESDGRDLWALLRTLRAFRGARQAGRLSPAALGTDGGRRSRRRVRSRPSGCARPSPPTASSARNFGPWSAGSGMVLLLRAANEQLGSPGALVRERRARRDCRGARNARRGKAGGEIRTGARVARVLVRDERARGVVARRTAPRSTRARWSRPSIRSSTFLQLCDPIDLAPEFLWRMRNYRAHGTLAKLNLALSALPAFTGDRTRGPVRTHPHRARPRLSRARVRSLEVRALLDRAVHRAHDPDAARSVAGAGGRARAVRVRAVRALPAARAATGRPSATRWRGTRSTPSNAMPRGCARSSSRSR